VVERIIIALIQKLIFSLAGLVAREIKKAKKRSQEDKEDQNALLQYSLAEKKAERIHAAKNILKGL